MASTGEAKRVTLGRAFDSRPNALNFLRLCLALEVVVWHAYALRGSTWLPDPVEFVLADIAVDSFFAVSGFLIARSWMRRGSVGAYFAARARRILPGLGACLTVTAFLFAPLAAALSGSKLSTLDQLRYVTLNLTLWPAAQGSDSWSAWSISGTPDGSVSASWNGSLWSLSYEAAWYLGLAALGLVGLLRVRIMVMLFVTFWCLSLLGMLSGIEQNGYPIFQAPRTGLMFVTGILLWLLAERVPFSRALAAASVIVLTLSVLLPNYRMIAAPAIAYGLIWAGVALGSRLRLGIQHDLSYGVYIYGFPVQQLLLVVGLEGVGWVAFVAMSVAAVVPIAAASWFLVEQPTLRSRSSRVRSDPSSRQDGAVVGDFVDAAEPELCVPAGACDWSEP